MKKWNHAVNNGNMAQLTCFDSTLHACCVSTVAEAVAAPSSLMTGVSGAVAAVAV